MPTAPGWVTALCRKKNDVTLKDMAELCDVFYIGGTKVGALFGEAVVITNNELKKDFPYMIKQKGGLLAKGRLLGIQFEVLFEDGLYYRISSHADKAADIIRQACEKRGLGFLCPSYTNPAVSHHAGHHDKSPFRKIFLCRNGQDR